MENKYMILTENDILCGKQWVVNTRLILEGEILYLELQKAVNRLVGLLPTLGGSLDISNKRIVLNQHKINVQYQEQEEIDLKKQYNNTEFLDKLLVPDCVNGGRLFSVMLTRVRTTYSVPATYSVVGLSFSHGIVDGCGMYLVTCALLQLLQGKPINLSDDRENFYREIPISHLSFEETTCLLKTNHYNPLYFGNFLFGKLYEKATCYFVQKEQLTFMKSTSLTKNKEINSLIIEQMKEYYNYSEAQIVIGQIYDARFRLKCLQNYIGNMSYIMTNPIIENIPETLNRIMEKICNRDKVLSDIHLFENSLRHQYYIPNLDMRKQTILTNNHSNYYDVIANTAKESFKLVRMIPHQIGDCILITKETDSDYSVYYAQQFGRKNISNFLPKL